MSKQLHASSFERRFLCPGSFNAEQDLPDIKSDVAESGTRIHNGLRLYFSRTVPDTTDVSALCKLDDREQIIFKWFANTADQEILKHGGAEKVWPEFKFPETDDGILGTADLIVRCNDGTVICFDYKTGYGRTLTAEKNLQIRVYAVKTAETFGCVSILAYLFSAGNAVEDSAFTSCEYDPDEIAESKKEIYAIRDACLKPNAKRIPGSEQCKYCRACGTERCPESIENLSKLNLPAILPDLTPELIAQCPAIWARIQTYDVGVKAFKAFIKDKLKENPDCIPGLMLKPGVTRREITDAEAVFNIGLENHWFDQGQFVSQAITVSLPKIEKLAKENLKLSVKEIKEIVNQKLAPCIETKTTEPSVVMK